MDLNTRRGRNLMKKPRSPAAIKAFFKEQGRKAGKLSAAARMLKMTPEQRSAVAKKAVTAREAKRRTAAAEAAAGARWSKYAAICGMTSDELRRRVDASTEVSIFCFKRVCLDGEDPSVFANVVGVSEENIGTHVQEAIQKLKAMNRQTANRHP